MSPFKVLGGAVLGIAAVAAAPMTGGGSLLGAASLGASLTGAGAVATGAGLAGAVVGASLESEDEIEKKAKNKAEEEATAKLSIEIEKLSKELDDATSQLKSHAELFNLILAISAVGISCAYSDGYIADEEKEAINEFTGGISSSALPVEIKDKIEGMIKNPPSLKDAFELAQKVGLDKFDLFDDIIEVTILADNVEHKDEIEFKNDWNREKRVNGIR